MVLFQRRHADAHGDHLHGAPRHLSCGSSTYHAPAASSFDPAFPSLPLPQCIGAAQMAVWAKAKHERLRRVFDGKDGREKYPRRWILLPPFY